ncbi:PepSY domain-containing protein [Comamonas sp. GB3 AK4-5]|uniref:PepSY domain-containing protein n=1 Tax=Comamonas sp. GB3 AK4-5 TaxID=3231487 RepID=UPI00351E5D7E
MTRIFHKFSRSAGVQLAAVALAAGLAGVAMAQTPAVAQAAAPTALSWKAEPGLTIRQVYDRLEAAGYRDLREIEWDHSHYEVKARDAQGTWVKLDVDGSTGAVLRSRNKR